MRKSYQTKLETMRDRITYHRQIPKKFHLKTSYIDMEFIGRIYIYHLERYGVIKIQKSNTLLGRHVWYNSIDKFDTSKGIIKCALKYIKPTGKNKKEIINNN